MRASEARIGGKAAGLARLQHHGANVPPWFVVPTEHFRAHLESVGLLGAGALANESDASTITKSITERDIGKLSRQAVAVALAGLGPGPYAVRSSMAGEDSARASFAGLLETYLYLHSEDEVLDAIRACWASAFAPRVVEYRRRQGMDAADVHMGVVVQRMVVGDVSGVLFTANPVTARRDHALVTACWGLGEGVVNGTCNADEYVCAHDGTEVSTTVAHKDLAVRVAEGDAGTIDATVPDAQRAVRCLSPARASELVVQAVGIADAFGCPQDIEWTVVDGETYILQSRPITTLPAPPVMRPIADGQRVVWDNSNIQESYCGVTTPLTFTFAARAYGSVYRQTMRAVSIPEATVDEHGEVLDNLLGLVRGRVYYNINNWYRGLLLLPSFGQNKADMERMMGLDSPVDFVEDEHLSLAQKLGRAPRLAVTLAKMQRAFSRLDDDVDAFMAHFDAACARMDRAGFASAALPALRQVLDQLRAELLDRWHVPIVNDFYVMMTNGKLRRLVASVTDEPDRVINQLLSAEEGIESAEPTRWLMRMAAAVRASEELTSVLSTGTPAQAIAALRARGDALAEDIEAFLDKYGDRCMGELKLETVSLRQDASFVATVLRNYVARADLDADALAAHERRQRDEAEAMLKSALSAGKWRKFQKTVAATRTAIAARERMRLARTRMFGLYRDAYLAIGARLAEADRLDEPRDVFYLTVDEIDAHAFGNGAAVDLADYARQRKQEFSAYEAEDLPNRIETVGPLHAGLSLAAEPPSESELGERVLRGLGCSPGVVEAELCIIRKPTDDLSVNGKVLTTTRTDPGWAPLFPSAAAILVERGSALSHSAVLARELGIPAVVGVPKLLAIVEQGERVRLDGAAGTVTRLEDRE